MLRKVVSRPVAPDDMPLISALHDRVFGPGRFARTAYRVREQMAGQDPFSPFCRIAVEGGRVIAALRMSEIAIGGKTGALLLGPLVVAPEFAGQGYGRGLVGEAMEAARAAGIRLVVLVGDKSYYGRFGFERVEPGTITLPGPVNPARILAAELTPSAAADYAGPISGC